MAEAVLDWVAGLPSVAAYLVLMVLAALENVFPPVPADVALVFGAFLARSRGGVLSLPVLGVLCWLANTVTAAGTYLLARRYGEAAFASGPLAALLPPAARAEVQRAYDRHGVAGIFFSRFLPGVRAAVTPVAGLIGMDPVRALVPAATASAIWYAFLVTAGTVAGDNWQMARAWVEDTTRVLGLVAVACVSAAAWWLWRVRSRAS